MTNTNRISLPLTYTTKAEVRPGLINIITTSSADGGLARCAFVDEAGQDVRDLDLTCEEFERVRDHLDGHLSGLFRAVFGDAVH